MPPIPSSHTPLMSAVRRCFRLAAQVPQEFASIEKASHPFGSGTAFGRVSRRDFVKGALALGAASLLPGCKSESADAVVIVGAGIAGLAAAYRLAKGGIRADVFEAGPRVGGRILTLKDAVVPGMFAEAGGEFVDSSHADMLGLAKELGLNVLDRESPEFGATTHGKLSEFVFHFGGRPRSLAEVIAEAKLAAARMQPDMDSLPEDISADIASGDGKTRNAVMELDRLSIEEYFRRRGVSGWFRDLLIAAYITEFGLDAGEQSCLNLLTMVSFDTAAGRFKIFGDSDERFCIEGGNQRVTEGLARKLEGQIQLGHRLEAVDPDGTGFRLTFQGPNGSPVERRARAVILAVPFSVLRSVELRVELPAAKRKAISELGYGTNSKLFLGFNTRPWRSAGSSGYFFTDGPMQSGWDHTQTQKSPAGTDAGGLTIFQGGSAGLALGVNGPMASARSFSDPLETLFPGTRAASNGGVSAFHWPTYPLSLGSYACYKPGQWTSLAGEEGKPVGYLYFAGEHCSRKFQGYMNGGAETGRMAAEAILSIKR